MSIWPLRETLPNRWPFEALRDSFVDLKRRDMKSLGKKKSQFSNFLGHNVRAIRE